MFLPHQPGYFRMCFQRLGDVAFILLGDISVNRVGARDTGLVIRDRRIDSSLLTESFEKNWNVRVQGEERMRQACLLERTRRQAPRLGRQARNLS